jgi:hypothetical protein
VVGAVRLAAAVAEEVAALVEWAEVDVAGAATAGLQCREEVTAAAELVAAVVGPGRRKGPVAAAPVGWPRTGT